MLNIRSMGTIYVTNDLDLIRTIPKDSGIRIISLDESDKLDKNDPNIIIGTCLLPPTEAVMAEIDGQEDMYDIHYAAYLNSPCIIEFITAIIAALYRKRQLVMYAPQMGQNLSITKLMQFMWDLYGIGIGIPNQVACKYDRRCIPIWMNLMYDANVVDANEFLLMYPPDAPINDSEMNRIIDELRPVGRDKMEQAETINRYRRRLQSNKNLKMPVFGL